MDVRVATGVMETLVAEAAGAYPHECCGLLLGEDSRIERVEVAENVHPQPGTHFEIDPQVLIDAHRSARSGGPQVIGYFHSHPNGLARPSETDASCAAGGGLVWAIIANGTVTFWHDLPGGFERLSLGPDTR